MSQEGGFMVEVMFQDWLQTFEQWIFEWNASGVLFITVWMLMHFYKIGNLNIWQAASHFASAFIL